MSVLIKNKSLGYKSVCSWRNTQFANKWKYVSIKIWQAQSLLKPHFFKRSVVCFCKFLAANPSLLLDNGVTSNGRLNETSKLPSSSSGPLSCIQSHKSVDRVFTSPSATCAWIEEHGGRLAFEIIFNYGFFECFARVSQTQTMWCEWEEQRRVFLKSNANREISQIDWLSRCQMRRVNTSVRYRPLSGRLKEKFTHILICLKKIASKKLKLGELETQYSCISSTNVSNIHFFLIYMPLQKSTVLFESTFNSIKMANLLFMLFFCTLFMLSSHYAL